MHLRYPSPQQKKRLRILVLTLALFLLMGCTQSRAEVAPAEAAASGVTSTLVPEPAEGAENRATSTLVPSPAEGPEKQEVQPFDIAVTGTAVTKATPTIKVSGTATPSVVVTVSREASSASERPNNATITPKVLHTPKARTEWRSMGGELFLRFKGGIKIFEYYLTVPENWGGIFEMQQEEEDAILFFYTPDADLEVEIFRLTALQQDSWQQKKAAGDTGNQVFEQRGAVFVLDIAQENPFDSEEAEAETFQTMLEDVPDLIEETLEIISRRE